MSRARAGSLIGEAQVYGELDLLARLQRFDGADAQRVEGGGALFLQEALAQVVAEQVVVAVGALLVRGEREHPVGGQAPQLALGVLDAREQVA